MKCYASHLGNCSGGPSKEHVISRSVLALAGDVILVSGFPWQEKDKYDSVGINSLASKVLCQNHNNSLSKADNEGRLFVQSIKSIFETFVETNESPVDDVIINGELIELWLLKILCGIYSLKKKGEVPKEWIKILFEKEKFGKDCGFYFFGFEGNASWFFNLVKVISVRDDKNMFAGAKFGIGGLSLLLALGKPNFENPNMKYMLRPKRIVFSKGEISKNIVLSWNSYPSSGTITMNILGTTEDPPPEYVPLVSPTWPLPVVTKKQPRKN